MKIRRQRLRAPSPPPVVVGDGHSSCAEHPTLIGVTGRMLTTWADTSRLLLVLIVLAVLAAGVLWLVPLDVELGPIKITRM